MHRKTKAQLLESVKTCTVWPRPTKRSLTFASKLEGNEKQRAAIMAAFYHLSITNRGLQLWHVKLLLHATATSVFVRMWMLVKQRPPSAFSSIQVYLTKLVKYTMARLPPTGWSKSKSAASPLPQRRLPLFGVVCVNSLMNTASILSTPQVTLTLPSR